MVAAAMLIIFWAFLSGAFSNLGVQSPTIEKDDLVSVTRPIRFTVTDPLGGSGVSSPTVYIYDGQVLLESISGTSAGIANSTQDYSSGKVLNVKVVASGYVTRWFSVTVPKMKQADVNALSYISVPLTTYNLGTFTITCTRSDTGATVTTGSAINMSTFASTPLQLSLTVRNSEDNSGWISSYDPINRVNYNMAFWTATTGSYLTIQNAGQYVSRGTTSNYLHTISDDSISKHLVSGVYVKPGVQEFTINLYRGSLTSAANQTLTFDVYKYFDTAYFAQQGIGGPDASSAASQFEISFYV